jgi:folate-dependent phosphoribosylglycinamide formyltransferase PurN
VYRFGWFSTGRDKAARDLLQAAYDSLRDTADAEIEFVFCSRERGESPESDRFLDLASKLDIPIVTYSYQEFRRNRDGCKQGDALPPWRLEYDRQVMQRLQPFKPGLCFLAGYMLIVGAEICRYYDMLNLHPAAPGGPAGTWQQVIWQLIAGRAEGTGVMMHLVTPQLDRGPVVTYCTFPIIGGRFDGCWREIQGQSADEVKRSQGEDNALFRLIRQAGCLRELPLVTTTMQAFYQGKVMVDNGKVVDSTGKVINGYDLTADIDRLIAGKGEEKQTL